MKKKMIALAGSLLVVAILVTSVGGVVVAAPQNGGCGEEDCCQEEMGPRFQWRAAGFLRDVMDYLGIAPEDIRELRGECRGPQELLEALGLSQEDVKEAMEAVLEEKVADGTLTQEQADRMMEWLDGEVGMRMGDFGMFEDICELLGLSPEEFREQLRGGKSLAEILEEQGVDEEELHEAILAGVTERIEEKVADGTLTQEQADRILGRMAFGPGPLMRGRGGELPGRSMGPGAFGRWREHAGEEVSPGVWRPGKGAGHMNNCG